MVGGAADPIEALPISDQSEDSINAALHARNHGRDHDRSLAGVRAAFDAGHERLLRFIATVPDEALAARYGFIGGNAAGHYDEHMRMLEAWRARGQS